MYSQTFIIINSIFVVAIFLSLANLARSQPNLRCAQALDSKLLDKCCGASHLSELVFGGNKYCEKYEPFSACFYDCLFKAWKLLNEGGKLNNLNLYSMISMLYTKFPSYGLALKKGFENCEPLASKYGDFIQMYSAQMVGDFNVTNGKCPVRAMFYAKCAGVNVFISCPPELWQFTNECDTTRRSLATCVKLLNDLSEGDSDASRKGNSQLRSAATTPNRKHREASNHWYTAFFNWLVF